MLQLEQIKRALWDRRIDVIARETGIHRNTIAAIRSGRVTNPRYETMRKLSAYIQERAV